MFIENNKIVVGKEEDNSKKYIGFISEKLHSAFEKYDNSAKFLIKAYYIHSINESFIYEDKTVNEWWNNVQSAKAYYNTISKGYKEKTAEKAKREMEIADEKYKNALEAEREFFLKQITDYLSEKGAEIISSDKNDCTVFFISSKNTVINLASEEKEIEIDFYLGSDDNAVGNTVYTVCE